MTTGPRARLDLPDAAGLAAALLVGAANAWRFLGYPCDDAVISFRSVANFEHGHGWVYNVGERLETYTNLGLVWLLTAARALGCDLFASAAAIGFVAALGTIAAMWWLAREVGVGRSAWAPALFLGASTTLVGQAGSGLETTLSALFLCLGSARILAEARPRADGRPRRHGLGILLLCLAVLVRLDGFLVVGGFLVLKPLLLPVGERRRAAFADVLVAALALAGQAAFRLAYYGSPIPNPVRTKVGLAPDVTVYKAGLNYLLEWMRTDFGVGVLIGGLGLALAAGRRAQALVVLCLGWCLFIITSGGDHMPYSRFLAPMLALFAVTATVGWQVVFAGHGRLRAATGAVFVIAIAIQPLWLSVSRGNIPAKNWQLETYRREIGEFLAQEAAARGRPLVVAASAVGYVGYYGGEQVRIVDMLGLCDQHVAIQGRRDLRLLPGHQVGDGPYVLAQHPDLILLGSMTPGDLWQRQDPQKLLAEVLAAGADAWADANDHRFLVSERELLGMPELARDYEFRTVRLSSGRELNVLGRRG